MNYSHEVQSRRDGSKEKFITPGKESYDKPRQHIKEQRHHFAGKGPCSQSCGSSSSHVQMWEVNYKEDWAPKNWCFQIVMLDKTLESPLDNKEIKPIKPEGNQSWLLSWSSSTLAIWCEELTHWKRPWCWEGLRAGGEGGDREWCN